MPALYANLDGRYYVNEDFIKGVEQLFPATTVKMPLGYHVYVGWEGKDEVFFNTHDPIGRLGRGDGQAYEVMCRAPDFFDRFLEKILPHVNHQDISEELKKTLLPKTEVEERIRLTAHTASLQRVWGKTLDERIKMARKGGGLYGYKVAVQKACQRASDRLEKRALKLVKEAARKDEKVLDFLVTHAKRASSPSARALVNVYKASLPKLDLDDEIDTDDMIDELEMPKPAKDTPASTMPGDEDRFMEEAKPMGDAGNFDDPDHSTFKVAGKSKWGMYGFPMRTARLGLAACNALREEAGVLASDLHSKKAKLYDAITGFLQEHNKTAKCGFSGLILDAYPESSMELKLASEEKPEATKTATVTNPSTVAEWLAWTPPKS
jgi:hypothetical protein